MISLTMLEKLTRLALKDIENGQLSGVLQKAQLPNSAEQRWLNSLAWRGSLRTGENAGAAGVCACDPLRIWI